MDKLEILVRFDIMLTKNKNLIMNYYEIYDILNNITTNKDDQNFCFDFFIKNNFIIQDNNNNYYYTLEKREIYKPYKNYKKILDAISNNLIKELDFSSLNI